MSAVSVSQVVVSNSAPSVDIPSTEETILFADGITIGDTEAEYAIIEFTDIECPYCAKFHEATFPKIKEKLIDTGNVLYVARDLPLVRIHPSSAMAAVVLRCSAQQDNYWELKDALFQRQKEISPSSLVNIATIEGMDIDKLVLCANNKEEQSSVQESMIYANRIGLKSTPSFVVGVNTGNGVIDYRIIKGAKKFERFEQILDYVKKTRRLEAIKD